MSEKIFVDIDALVNELGNFPLPTEIEAYFTDSEPGRAFLSELYAVFNGFLSQFFLPDATTFISTCDSLVPLVDQALLSAKNRKLVLDILELADVMFDKFVSVSLTLQQTYDPLSVVPTHSIIRTRLLDLINQCLAFPHYLSDISSELQTLKSKIQEDQAKAALSACDTKWIYDLPDFKELDSWLTENIDIPAAALEIVAQGYTSTCPTSNEISMLSPSTTAQLRRNSSILMQNLRAPQSTPSLGASQSLSVLPTSASRPIKGLPKRGASLSRTQSLSAMLPPQAQARVLVALGTVTEVEGEQG